ncbi:hypothetical protein FBEOM_7553 [Fusarium beomiforme]|uniref:Uncharacterized protein n=1 Tax=Fusarium beomiforme TaxID=44412 RepID=A0A9P5AGY2_9HYPO|nr:hypothetical protein FBEOM_7553 [Fusarium beomiforme]
MSYSAVEGDLTEIHFDTLCKIDDVTKMLDVLLAANEDDAKRWSSCPSFGRFVHKIFWLSQSTPQLAPTHPDCSINLDHPFHFSPPSNLDSAPQEDEIIITLPNPSTGEPVVIPVLEILAGLHGYTQHELSSVC